MSKKKSPLDRLRCLFPPPEELTEAGLLTLRRAVERTLGLALPDDLYDLSLGYGTGGFGTAEFIGLLRVYNPFSSAFVQHVTELLAALRAVKECEGESYVPYGIHPDRQGLLPFGQDDEERL